MNKHLFWLIVILALLVGAVLFLHTSGLLVVFEDGSFWVGPEGSIFGGCIPFQLCD